MAFQLRPYQQESVDSVIQAFHQKHILEDRNNRSAGVIISTGGGKTECFIALTDRFLKGKKGIVLILSHRDILTEQTRDRFQARIGMRPDILQGNIYPTSGSRIVISTMQSSRNWDKFKIWRNKVKQGNMWDPYSNFDEPEIGLIIIDEMHLLGTDSYDKILSYFPDALVAGYTASPFREGKLMTGLLDTVAYSISLNQLIEEKYLVPPRLIGMKVDEFAHNQAVDRSARCLKTYIDKEKGNSCLIYMRTKQDAATCRNAFRDQGISAEVVTSDTSKDDRRQIFADYREGKVKVLTTVNVLTEGFDAPIIGSIFMPYQVGSPTTYIQRVGRGLRPQDGNRVVPEHWKQECRVYYGGTEPEIQQKQWEKMQEAALKAGTTARPDNFQETLELLEMIGDKKSDEYKFTYEVVDIIEQLNKMKMTNVSEMLNQKQFPEKFLNDISKFKGGLPKHKPMMPGEITDKQKSLLKKEGFKDSQLLSMTKSEASSVISAIFKFNGWQSKESGKWQIPEGIHKGKSIWDVHPAYFSEVMKRYPMSETAKMWMQYKNRKKT